jgi:hypothetical protein
MPLTDEAVAILLSFNIILLFMHTAYLDITTLKAQRVRDHNAEASAVDHLQGQMQGQKQRYTLHTVKALLVLHSHFFSDSAQK